MPFSENSTSSFFRYHLLISLAFIVGMLPAALNFIVDPYAFFFDRDRSKPIKEIAEKAHYPLWKLSSYKSGNFETIVLGDSRARALREKYWNSFEFPKTKNLAYGGGTIPEVYETFKIVKEDPKVQNLVIGIQLRSFDEDHKQGMNRVPEAISLLDHPLDYVFNWTIAKTSLKIAGAQLEPYKKWLGIFSLSPSSAQAASQGVLTGVNLSGVLKNEGVGEYSPRQLPGKFQRQIERNARSDWRSFEFSETYWSYIEEIARWSKANNKRIIFVIPPTIVEMQSTIAKYGLSLVNRELRERLSRHGLVLDFDYPGELTRDVRNFSDAYHFNAKVARQIVGEAVFHLSGEKKVLQRVEKRRKFIRCAKLKQEAETLQRYKDTVFESGTNCRVWRSSTS